MILSDYAYLVYKHKKNIGGIEKIEERRVWLKHIKKVRIKDGDLLIYAMKEECMDLNPDKYNNYRVFGHRNKINDIILERDIFEYFRIKLSDVIKLEF